MKVFGIVCSPRLHGNTERLMKEALNSAKEGGAEVEIFTLTNKIIYPCDACESCVETGQCRIEDDMEPLYHKILEADGIIFGSPVYFWSIAAQAKIIIDRTYVFRRKRLLRKKVGAALITTRRVGGSGACSVFNNYFNIQRMICAGNAICFGSDKGDILEDEVGMTEVKALGRAVVRYIKMVAQNSIDEDVEKGLETPFRESSR